MITSNLRTLSLVAALLLLSGCDSRGLRISIPTPTPVPTPVPTPPPVPPPVPAPTLPSLSFATDQDIQSNGASGLSIKNSGSIQHITGVFAYGIGWVSASETDCQTITGGNSNEGSYMAGAILTPLTVPTATSVPIGRNYLYNMLMTWIYFGQFNGYGFSCALSGCSWPGDTAKFNWCIKVGVVKPINTPYTASAPPFAWPTASLIDNYDYDAIPNVNNYVWIGPFSCDDQTLECTAVSPAITSHEQNF